MADDWGLMENWDESGDGEDTGPMKPLLLEPIEELKEWRKPMDGLTEGHIVHYVLNEGRYKGEHRAAIVAKVWRNGDGTSPENGVSNLTVFTDAANDDLPAIYGRGSVLYDASGAPGTWHWIEKA